MLIGLWSSGKELRDSWPRPDIRYLAMRSGIYRLPHLRQTLLDVTQREAPFKLHFIGWTQARASSSGDMKCYEVSRALGPKMIA